MMSIPVRETIICAEELIKKFKEAVKKKKLNDAIIEIEDFMLTFRTREGEIKLITLNNYIEIKTRNCVVTTSVDKRFVKATDIAPKLVADEVYTVDELVTLLRKGFRELLLAASDL